jgi:hypothetical protein
MPFEGPNVLLTPAFMQGIQGPRPLRALALNILFPSGGLLFAGPKRDLCPFCLIKKDQKIKAQQKFA